MLKIRYEDLKFVVIEDNAHMRRIIRTILRGFGSREIYEAEDGASGLEAVESFVPDIAIIDIHMPIFDGFEVMRMIRNPESCKTPFIPIILLTASAEKKTIVAARDAGATEILRKPVSAAGLYKRIQNIVANPRPYVRTRGYFGPCRRRLRTGSYHGPDRRLAPDDANYFCADKEVAGEVADTNQIDFDSIEIDA